MSSYVNTESRLFVTAVQGCSLHTQECRSVHGNPAESVFHCSLSFLNAQTLQYSNNKLLPVPCKICSFLSSQNSEKLWGQKGGCVGQNLSIYLYICMYVYKHIRIEISRIVPSERQMYVSFLMERINVYHHLTSDQIPKVCSILLQSSGT